MELIYNELSATPLSQNRYLANQKVSKFIDTYKGAKQRGFNKIRFSRLFHEIEIADGYTLANWLDETNQRNLKDLILGARTYPFIDEEDTWAENEYLSHSYYYENEANGILKTECIGLATAHIYDTLSVGFSMNPVWETNTIPINKVDAITQESLPINVTNVFSNECFENELIKTFIERIGELILIQSQLKPQDKPIHLSDDHGKDTLDTFARQLRNSPYVTAIINSLPYNSQSTNFIRRVYPNGLIEMVLYWTDKGLGMVIQTTGRNYRETSEIGRILEEEFT